jgi:hypothetical protein
MNYFSNHNYQIKFEAKIMSTAWRNGNICYKTELISFNFEQKITNV